MKRYETRTVLTGEGGLQECVDGEWCMWNDIKDSLIEWHKVEDGLPEYISEGGELFTGNAIVEGKDDENESAIAFYREDEGWLLPNGAHLWFKPIKWAYLPKSPKE